MTLHEAQPPPQLLAPLTLSGSRCGLKGTIPQFHPLQLLPAGGLHEEEEGGERWGFLEQNLGGFFL